jgi:pimeloyl-ACP methyl ester carboxylesterase
MTTLIVIVVVLCAGAVGTVFGVRAINKAHRPRGRFIDVGGLPQHVIEMGAAAPGALPVVLLHGAGANLEDMNLALGEQLAARYRVILIDRPGMGFSARPERDGSSPTFQAGVLRELLDRLGIDRAILVGHSWGGTLALTFALDFPQRAAGLVLIAPPTHPGVWHVTWLNSLLAGPVGWLFAHTIALPCGAAVIQRGSRRAFLPQIIPDRYVKRSAAMLVLRPRSLMANWADVGDLESFLVEQAKRYGSLTVPTIAFGGDKDYVAPPAGHGEKLAADAPVVKLIVLRGFGHMLHHAAADQVVAAVDEVAAAAERK